MVKRTSAALDTIVAPATGITILIYHRVSGGSDSAVDLDPDLFEQQLAHLAAHHDVITLDEAVHRLATADATNRPSVVITFDDGTADFTDVAVPALVRHGLPATLYAATRFIAFPMLADDVGNWLEPLGVLSGAAESVVVVAAALALLRRAVLVPVGDRKAPASAATDALVAGSSNG